jgi:cytidylate kinase
VDSDPRLDQAHGSDPDLAPILNALANQTRSVVLVDGKSGSGKTELARRLAPAIGAQLVRLDDLYPGWDGLEAASAMVSREILTRHRWRRWDWSADAPAEWHELDRTLPLVVEGSGALTRATRPAATFGIWVDLHEPARKRRALARDGVTYEPYWDRWAAQERIHFERERPDLLADLTISGDSRDYCYR